MENSSYMASELNRIADPAEFAGEQYAFAHPAITAEHLQGQHPIRAWEYSQALRALELWGGYPALFPDARFADVGGAGSNFYRLLTPGPIDVIDPTLATPDGQQGIVHGLLPGATAVKYPLETWASYKQNNAAYSAVFCLSVIEHVKNPQPFIDLLCALVRPGGLLFLTCDCGALSEDTYHFHWMRKWIATADLLERITVSVYGKDFVPLGDVARFIYHGPTVFNYSVASLAFRKDRR